MICTVMLNLIDHLSSIICYWYCKIDIYLNTLSLTIVHSHFSKNRKVFFSLKTEKKYSKKFFFQWLCKILKKWKFHGFSHVHWQNSSVFSFLNVQSQWRFRFFSHTQSLQNRQENANGKICLWWFNKEALEFWSFYSKSKIGGFRSFSNSLEVSPLLQLTT